MNKLSKPLNRAADKLGCEAFSPQELDLEVVKVRIFQSRGGLRLTWISQAARILRSFCIDGFYVSESDTSSHATASDKKSSVHGKDRKALRKIPPEAIRRCKGLAIFTCMRFGLNIGGGNGCGILIRHLPDGSWSAPSGIHMASLTGGWLAGLDVYDCVAVINTEDGMEGFTRVRGSFGAEVAATVGPLGVGQIGDLEVSKRVSPVWTYTKNRGLYAGAHLNGTVFIERTNENPRFYGKEGIRHAEILSGQVKPPAGSCDVLYQTLNAIEGKTYDAGQLPPPYEDVAKN